MATGHAWVLERAGAPLVQRSVPIAAPGPMEAVVEVIACGLCHTDLGYADGSVRPNHVLPLVLGHEIVGQVVAAGAQFAALIGCTVIVPAVLPCGACAFCLAGRGNACPQQKMPGNDIDGGFGSHVVVPAAPLVRLDGVPDGMPTWPLAVVADAVSTAWQAVARAQVEAGDAVFVVGAGGVGSYVAQIAATLGARVVACDVDHGRLDQVQRLGIGQICHVRDRAAREVRQELHALAANWGIPSLRWRIFECSGTLAGQTLAFALLARAATLVQVGYCAKPLELRWSNLMAFDATVYGSWGCPPLAYPAVLAHIFSGAVRVDVGVASAPMSQINNLLATMADHRLDRRMVLDPRA